MVLQRRRGGGAVLRFLFIVGAGRAGAGAGQLADAFEVVALGAVLPFALLDAREVGVVDARGLLAGIEPGVLALAARLGGHLGRRLGAARALGRSLAGSGGLFLGFEERVLVEHLLDFLLQLERRQLQQADRLLQLRRQRQMLREADLKRWFHDKGPALYMRKCSPR